MALNHEVNGSPVEVKHINIQGQDLDYTQSGTGSITVSAQNPVLNSVTLDGACEQRNLPSGHQQLEYLQGDGTAYIETDVVPTNNTGMKIVFEYATSGAGATSGVYDGVLPRQDTFFISTNSGSIGDSVMFVAHRGATLSTAAGSTETEIPIQGKTYTFNINYKNSGTMYIEGFTQANIGTEDVLSNKVLLFARLNYNNGNIAVSSNKIKYVEFTEGTEVIRKYYPDRYNNELGLYDTITNTFLTNKNSTGSFTAGSDVVPTPDNPMDIVCNNGAIKLAPNLVNTSLSTRGYYINSSREIAESANWSISDYIPVTAGKEITVSGLTYNSVAARFNYYNSNKVITSTINYGNGTLTVPSGSSYIRICYRWVDDESTVRLNVGNSATAVIIDGTQEKVEVHTKNLISTASQYVLLGQFADASGNVVDSSVNFQTIKFPCKPNTTYTASISRAVKMLRVCTYNSSGTFVQRYNTQLNDGVKTITFTTGASVAQFNIGAQINTGDVTQNVINSINWQIEQGSTATTYEPYYNGGTATAQMLLKVGDYKDTQEVISGAIGRETGILVLTGTESWSISLMSNCWTIIDGTTQTAIPYCPPTSEDADRTILCTHFQKTATLPESANRQGYIIKGSQGSIGFGSATAYPTVEGWNAYLADQYAAGTPVIVVYPLATPTTETVTGQTLTMKKGTNTVGITQASIANLPLAIDYTAIGTKAVNYVVKDDKLVFADSGLYLSGPNTYTVQGSPTIVDNVVSGFKPYTGPAAYIKTASSFDMDQAFETKVYFKLSSTISSSGTIISRSSNGKGGLALQIASANRCYVWVYNSSGVAVVSAQSIATETGETFTANGEYVLTASKDATGYHLIIKDTQDTVIFNYTYSDAITMGTSGFSFGVNLSDAAYSAFTGSIDLNRTYIQVGGSLWFYGKNYASQNIAPVPSGYTYGTTTTSAIGFVDMRTQQFTAAPSGATLGKDE